MASKTSHWALLSPNQRIAESEGRDMSEWASSRIVRIKRYNQPEHVLCFCGDNCVYDSDTPLVSPAIFEKVFEKVANSIGEGEVKDVISYREGVLRNMNFNSRV